MNKFKRYKIVIWILSLIVVIQGIFIIMLTRPKKLHRVTVPLRPRIAIVIDDWGYNLNNLPILEQLKYPLTMAILPNLDYSRVVSEELHQRGFEIILHLPMEPYEKYRLEKNTIMTSLDETTIKNILEEDLHSLTFAQGVSNHMGSKATEDRKTMAVIFKELKKRKLYFLDSLVSSRSICFELARKLHLLFCRRDVFLDNIEAPEYIRGQLYKLKTRARAYGWAIGIGHDRRVTLEVLKEAIPEIEKEGYKFVFVSELVK